MFTPFSNDIFISMQARRGKKLSCKPASPLSPSTATHLRNEDADQNCPMCSAGFVTNPDLQQHIRLHSDPDAHVRLIYILIIIHNAGTDRCSGSLCTMHIPIDVLDHYAQGVQQLIAAHSVFMVYSFRYNIY